MSAVKRFITDSVKAGEIDKGLQVDFGNVERATLTSLRDRLRFREPLTAEDVRAICNSVSVATLGGARDRAMLHTLASSGCRISEVVGMRRSDIKVTAEGVVVRILGKGRHEYENAPLSFEAVKWIDFWLEKRAAAKARVKVPAIFTRLAGRHHWPLPQPISRNGVYK